MKITHPIILVNQAYKAYKAREAAGGHIVLAADTLLGPFIDVFRLDLITVGELVILEVVCPDAAPGVRCAPDKRRAQGAHGLVDLCTGDLIDEPLVEIQGFNWMGDLDIHGAAGRDHLQVLRTHGTSAAAASVGVFDHGHGIGIPNQFLARRASYGTLHIAVSKFLSHCPLGLGKDSFKYLIHMKGMSNLHSDERATPALALNLSLASRGSDHLRSRPAIDLYHLPEPVMRRIYSSPVPYDGPLSSDHTEYVGKPWQVAWHENCYMAVDCLGICKYHTTFFGATLPNFEDWSKVLYCNTGLEMSPKDIWEVAERADMVERLFNIRKGMKKDDPYKGEILAERYFNEPCRRGAPDVIGKKIDRQNSSR